MFWNTPAWSVAAEFFFHASFPFLCGGLARRVRTTSGLARMFAAAVLAGVALYAGAIYLLNYAMPVSGETQYIALAYNPLSRYSEFFARCLAGQFFVRQRLGRNRLNRVDAHGRRLRDVVVWLRLAAVCARVWLPDYTGPSQWRRSRPSCAWAASAVWLHLPCMACSCWRRLLRRCSATGSLKFRGASAREAHVMLHLSCCHRSGPEIADLMCPAHQL